MGGLLHMSPSFLAPLLLLFAVYLVTSLFNLVRWRYHVLQLKAQGLPMPPHNVFFGHLPVVQKIISSLPSDAHGHYLPDELRRAYPDLGPNFYLDLAPFAPSMLVLTSPDVLHQVTQTHPLEKFPSMKKFLNPLTGGLDIVTMKAQMWKKWRTIFNPGFSAGHLMTLVPSIVLKTERFCSILEEHAEKGDIIKMKTLTDDLTMDIIGQILLEEDFDCQRAQNDLVNGIRKQIRWLSFGAEPNLFVRYHPLRPFIHWYYGSKVNAIVSKFLDQSFEDYKSGGDTTPRSVVSLAFKAHNLEKGEEDLLDGTSNPTREMDPFFKKICLSQIKLFLFSGHDTTSSSICYTLYLLSKHPSALQAVQQELNDVFSTDRTQTSQQISENPYLLNNLPYTTAVIKESLRLFPTVSSTRDGEPDFSVTDAQGRNFPTESFLVWVNPHAVQHTPNLWDQPEEFIPERWLGERRKEIIKGAWRAFEHGPRNCIGQELAMIESKIVLCMVVRDFVVRDGYQEGGKTVHGERAYQVQLSQPAGDLPCWIERI